MDHSLKFSILVEFWHSGLARARGLNQTYTRVWPTDIQQLKQKDFDHSTSLGWLALATVSFVVFEPFALRLNLSCLIRLWRCVCRYLADFVLMARGTWVWLWLILYDHYIIYDYIDPIQWLSGDRKCFIPKFVIVHQALRFWEEASFQQRLHWLRSFSSWCWECFHLEPWTRLGRPGSAVALLSSMVICKPSSVVKPEQG